MVKLFPHRVPIALLLLLPGCLAPKHVRPEAPVAGEWPQTPAGFEDAEPQVGDIPAAKLGWRELFRDPQLQELVETALKNNRNLRMALLQVERARAQYRISIANRLPDINLDVNGTYSRRVFGPGLSVEGQVYQVGLAMPSFELDLFGRLHHLSEAALNQYLATEEGALAAHISLISEVATAWLAERSLAAQLALAEQALEARRGSRDLAQQRFDAGVASDLDLSQADSLVASARARVATLAQERAQAHAALTLVVGAPVGDLGPPRHLEEDLVAAVPAGLPSELLTHRPDIRAAEERLRAAAANIGAARAAFFPRISLTASAGTASTELTGLFGPTGWVWALGAGLVQPLVGIFDNMVNLDIAEVDRELAVAEYERTIQAAFRDVADALVARGPLNVRVESLEQLQAAEARRLELAEQRYREGVASYLEVLDAQRSLLEAQQSVVQARQLRLTNAVDLYTALGGGLIETTTAAGPVDTAQSDG